MVNLHVSLQNMPYGIVKVYQNNIYIGETRSFNDFTFNTGDSFTLEFIADVGYIFDFVIILHTLNDPAVPIYDNPVVQTISTDDLLVFVQFILSTIPVNLNINHFGSGKGTTKVYQNNVLIGEVLSIGNFGFNIDDTYKLEFLPDSESHFAYTDPCMNCPHIYTSSVTGTIEGSTYYMVWFEPGAVVSTVDTTPQNNGGLFVVAGIVTLISILYLLKKKK